MGASGGLFLGLLSIFFPPLAPLAFATGIVPTIVSTGVHAENNQRLHGVESDCQKIAQETYSNSTIKADITIGNYYVNGSFQLYQCLHAKVHDQDGHIIFQYNK